MLLKLEQRVPKIIAQPNKCYLRSAKLGKARKNANFLDREDSLLKKLFTELLVTTEMILSFAQ